jgi:glycosyltransferase involved in cell wall biosynthesis
LVTRRWTYRGPKTGYERLLDFLDAGDDITSDIRYTRPYRLFQWIASRAGQQGYTPRSAGLEVAALARSARTRPRHLHYLYGEYDMHYSPALCHRLGMLCTAAFHNPPAELKRRISSPRALRHLSGAVLLGPSQREYFERELPGVPVEVIPHGVDTEFFRPGSGDPSRSGGPLVLLVGTHLRDWRLIHAFLYAARRALPTLRARFVVPREHAHLLPSEAWVSNHHPVTDDELLGLYREATFQFYGPADCVASNAVVESLACGLPVLAPRVGDVEAYLVGGAGFVFDAARVDDMVDAAVALWRDPDFLESVRVKARRRGLALDWREVSDLHRPFFARLSAAGLTRRSGAEAVRSGAAAPSAPTQPQLE